MKLAEGILMMATRSERNRYGYPIGRMSATFLIASCSVLSACTFAPGMRMQAPASIAVSAADSQRPAARADVPVTEITVDLIRQVREQREGSGTPEYAALFSKPAPYVIGPGEDRKSVV